MMKKALFFLFASLFALVCFTGCEKKPAQEQKNIATWQVVQKAEDMTPKCLEAIENQVFADPEFAEIKKTYDELLDTPSDDPDEQFIGYYFSIEAIDDISYDLALVEDYSSRVLPLHRFQIEKATGNISVYDVVNDNYDRVIPTTSEYSDFFAKNCQNLSAE